MPLVAGRPQMDRDVHLRIVGKLAILIHTKEGIAQWCALSVNLYRVATLPTMHDMRAAVPQALHQRFADDSGVAGKAVHSTECLEYLVAHGPQYGYFPKPAKL